MSREGGDVWCAHLLQPEVFLLRRVKGGSSVRGCEGCDLFWVCALKEEVLDQE
jgi:hypothetical protein